MATFIIYIIRWGIVLTLLYSLYGLFLKRETLHGFNRVVLLVILVASMVIPICQIETKERNYVSQGIEILEQQIILEERVVKKDGDYWADDANKEYASNMERIIGSNTGFDQAPLDAKDKNGEYKGWSWGQTLLLLIEIYAAGLVICWLRYFWQLTTLLVLIHNGKRAKIEGLPKHVHAITHPSVKTPCSWMRWIILNPSDVNTQAIINHEMAHIRYGHSWDMLLCEFTCRMLWCVPFAWMLRQDLRDVHEFQADRRVLQSGINDEEYQLLLIKKATYTGLQPVVNALNQSPIKRRFYMMYKKPSRRWVALKAAYLLPLSVIALVAFARPQTISDIEKQVETTETHVTHAIAKSGVMEKVKAVAESLGLQEPEEASPATTSNAPQDTIAYHGVAYYNIEHTKAYSDANLVKADLDGHEAPVTEPFTEVGTHRANELLDSTMHAVGARKLGNGTWIGHFQPSLNNDTVRISKVEIIDRLSRQTGKLEFRHNAADPYAYNMTLQLETRKERTGYYIRRLAPAKSKIRNYDRNKNDSKTLSMDPVLVKDYNPYDVQRPVAIERTKKETRVYVFLPCVTDYYEIMPEAAKVKEFERGFAESQYAIHDLATDDKYMFRSLDKSYFRLATVDTSKGDTVYIYQACLVFPPLDKDVKEVTLGSLNHQQYLKSFNLDEIPTKSRVIDN